MPQYRVRMRIYDDIEVNVDAPEGAIEQDIVNKAIRHAMENPIDAHWFVDQERVRVRPSEGRRVGL